MPAHKPWVTPGAFLVFPKAPCAARRAGLFALQKKAPMPQTRTDYPISGVFPVIVVMAVSAVAAIAIAAWLVHQVARRAIDKVPPEEVAPVILALGALLNPLRLFLPWSGRSESPQLPMHPGDSATTSPHNGTNPDLAQEVKHEA
jgi:hypothetical protein